MTATLLITLAARAAGLALESAGPQGESAWHAVEAIATCVLAVFTIFAFGVAFQSLRDLRQQVAATTKQFNVTMKASFLAKRPDVFGHLTSHYDALYSKLPRVDTTNETQQDEFRAVRAYWSLQLEQYQLYLEGFIDDEIFKYWMGLRCQEYAKPAVKDFQKLTHDALVDFHDTAFESFMREWIFRCWDGANVDDEKLETAMREARIRRKKHLEKIDIELPQYLGLDQLDAAAATQAAARTADPERSHAELGPNTRATLLGLHEDCILCAGEDRRELLQAVMELGPPKAAQSVRDYLEAMGQHGALDAPIYVTGGPQSYYRGYEFWRFDEFCLVLCGIGTGCLEPLLFEVLAANVVRKIVLVGTAGRMPAATVAMKAARVISPAFSAGTGIDAEAPNQPLLPNWSESLGGETVTGVSSDFYYSFPPPAGEAQGPLPALFAAALQRGTQLVDMESAQFYFFCRKFGGPELQYVAVKAAANDVANHAEQSSNSKEALLNSLHAAFRLLAIPGHAVR